MLAVIPNLSPKVALWPEILSATRHDKPPGSDLVHTAGLGITPYYSLKITPFKGNLPFLEYAMLTRVSNIG